MIIVDDKYIQEWIKDKNLIEAYKIISENIGNKERDLNYIADTLNIPISLCFAIKCIYDKNNNPKGNELDSIPLFSLLKGLYLPLSGFSEEKIYKLFKIYVKKRTIPIKEIIKNFINKEIGLTLSEKISYLVGDPYKGEPAYTGEDTLIQVLSSLKLASPYKLRERLSQIIDIGHLFIEEEKNIKSNPPITAKEALVILKNLPDLKINLKKIILRDLFLRAGRLERYFLVKIILRRLNLGYEYRTGSIIEVLEEKYNVSEEILENSIALSNIFEVTEILEKEGRQGLKKIVLKPLNPVSPALASNKKIEEKKVFPIWVECKYDGIRLLVHKDISGGKFKYCAFTRRKYDWLELIPNLEDTLKCINANSFIIDGELHGIMYDFDIKRPATVYEVYKFLRGDLDEVSIKLMYIAFDILYLNGKDLTNYQFIQRRNILENLIKPLESYNSLRLKIKVSDGHYANNEKDIKKWYNFYKSQGHEGVIAKILESPYTLGKRTDNWLKKKPEIYLDLVITGAFLSTGERGPQFFSSYLISCREGNTLIEVGRAEGLSYEKNIEIMRRILEGNLFTGEFIQERTSTKIKHGIKLLPSIVVTTKFEDIVRDDENKYSLRSPKIIHIRPSGDMLVEDINTYHDIKELYLKKRWA